LYNLHPVFGPQDSEGLRPTDLRRGLGLIGTLHGRKRPHGNPAQKAACRAGLGWEDASRPKQQKAAKQTRQQNFHHLIINGNQRR
jgi:hypothetical protein